MLSTYLGFLFQDLIHFLDESDRYDLVCDEAEEVFYDFEE